MKTTTDNNDADVDNHGVIFVPSNINNNTANTTTTGKSNNIDDREANIIINNNNNNNNNNNKNNNKTIETTGGGGGGGGSGGGGGGGCLTNISSNNNSDNGGDDGDDKHNDGDGDASSCTSGWGDGGDQSTSNRSTDTGYSPSNSSHSRGGGDQRGDQRGGAGDDPAFNIANKENRAVSFWRIAMLIILLLTTISVAFLVYTFVDNTERYTFELSFHDDTLKVYESLGSSMDKKLAAVDSLAMLMVSSANGKNETFPFTTLTDFAVKAAKVRFSTVLGHPSSFILHRSSFMFIFIL
jgi:hypothetical protein